MIRNLFTFNDVLHSVRNDTLYSVDSTGAQLPLATIGSIGGPVDMNQNLTQLIIGDGAQMYVWDGTTLTTDSTYVLGDSIAFIDQRIVFPLRNTQGFQWTSLGNARVIDPLDFASAEGSPDLLIAVLANLRELLMLGTTTGEVWHSVPSGDPVFQRSPSEYLQVGCAAARSAVVVGETPVWLGKDEAGQAQVMAGRGQRISTRAIEERFEGLALDSARAFNWSWGAHQFYMLNVPGVDTTLCFDLTFKQWFEAAELVAGDYTQWRPTCHAFAYGNHYFGADDDVIYKLNDASNFSGDTKVRDRIAPVLSSPGRERLRFPRIEFVQEKATGGTVMLRYSDDNGYTWSNWKYLPAGEVGRYKTVIASNRNGSAYDRVYQARMTDDVAWNPVMVNVNIE